MISEEKCTARRHLQCFPVYVNGPLIVEAGEQVKLVGERVEGYSGIGGPLSINFE